MVDITGKQVTLRSALAAAKILCSRETVTMIRDDKLPKGNLFDVARAAGLLGAKQTPQLIPHCHPIGIDHCEITFDYLSGKETGVQVRVAIQSIGRTGVEIEAMTAASVAALTIYDLLKPVDKQMSITDIELLEKTGGRSQWKEKLSGKTTAAVLVCSDSTAAGKREDKSGKIIGEMLESHGAKVVDYQVVADDSDAIQKQVQKWVKDDVHFIFTTGGTGLSPRDNTVQAITEILERTADGITEAIRVHGGMRTPLAMMSRSVAGSIDKTLIVTLPGSSNGARESLQAVLPGVFHARKMLKGGGH